MSTEIRADLEVADATDPDGKRPLTVADIPGRAGDSAPALATNASGIVGWLRALVDRLPTSLSGGRLKTEITQATGSTLLVEGAPGVPFLVESTTVVPTIVVDPDTGYDADDNLLAWTQNGVDYVATYDADGNLLTQGEA